MKKFLAIFLTVAMLASFMVVPALAAFDGKVTLTTDVTEISVEEGKTADIKVTVAGKTTSATGETKATVTADSDADTTATVSPATQETEDFGVSADTTKDLTYTVTGVKAGKTDVTFDSDDAAAPVVVEVTVTPKPYDGTLLVKDAKHAYLDSKDWTNKIAIITDSKQFQLNDGTKFLDTITKVDKAGAVDKFTVSEANGILTVTPKTGQNPSSLNAKKGDFISIILTYQNATAAFGVQYGETGSSADLTSLSIKAPKSTVLVQDDKLVLEADRTPAGSAEDVFWFSSKPSVVKVDSYNSEKATVIAGETGTAIISAISSKGLRAEIELTVIKGVAPTSVKFDKATYTLEDKKDASVTLSASVTPLNGKKKDLVFSFASNAIVATDATNGVKIDNSKNELVVDSTKGVDRAVVVYALIVEKDADDNFKKVLHSDVAVVTVKKDVTNVGDVAINNSPTGKKLVIGQEYQLTATAYDKDVNYVDKKVVDKKITWLSSDSSIAKVDEKTGLVTAVAKGDVKIYAIADSVYSKPLELTIVKEFEGNFKTVSANTVKVRALASSTSIELGTLKKGEVVDVVEVLGAWTKINYDGSHAFVASAALSDLATFSVTSSKLAVRSTPGASAAIGTLVYGDTVKVIGVYASNPAWTQILYKDNVVAYVASAYITEGSLTGIVTSGSLTFRVGASTTSAAYAQKLVKGQSVEILGREGAFLKVKTAEGFVGYAAAQYITIL